MKCVAYTDGSFMNGTYGYGGVIYFEDRLWNFYGGGCKPEYAEYHNIAPEVMAAIVAMSYAKQHNCTSLLIRHDYVGLKHWCTGDWKAKRPISRMLVDYYRKYTAMGLKITFEPVAGHSGQFYNNVADRNANHGRFEFTRLGKTEALKAQFSAINADTLDLHPEILDDFDSLAD